MQRSNLVRQALKKRRAGAGVNCFLVRSSRNTADVKKNKSAGKRSFLRKALFLWPSQRKTGYGRANPTALSKTFPVS